MNKLPGTSKVIRVVIAKNGEVMVMIPQDPRLDFTMTEVGKSLYEAHVLHPDAEKGNETRRLVMSTCVPCSIYSIPLDYRKEFERVLKTMGNPDVFMKAGLDREHDIEKFHSMFYVPVSDTLYEELRKAMAEVEPDPV